MHRDVKPHNVMIDHQQKKVPLQPGSNKAFRGRPRADHSAGQYLGGTADPYYFLWQTCVTVTSSVSGVAFYFAEAWYTRKVDSRASL